MREPETFSNLCGSDELSRIYSASHGPRVLTMTIVIARVVIWTTLTIGRDIKVAPAVREHPGARPRPVEVPTWQSVNTLARSSSSVIG